MRQSVVLGLFWWLGIALASGVLALQGGHAVPLAIVLAVVGGAITGFLFALVDRLLGGRVLAARLRAAVAGAVTSAIVGVPVLMKGDGSIGTFAGVVALGGVIGLGAGLLAPGFVRER